MLRLAAVAAAMALGWATLELRQMIERNEESVLAAASFDSPQGGSLRTNVTVHPARGPVHPERAPASFDSPQGGSLRTSASRRADCDCPRVDTAGGVARTARSVEAALVKHGLMERGKAWLGQLSGVGGGRDTLLFVPDGTDLARPVELVVYMEGHGSFADAAMEHRHASSIARLLRRGDNVVYVAPDAPSSAHGAPTAKTPYWQEGCAARPCAGGHAAPGDFLVFLSQVKAKLAEMACSDAGAAVSVRLHLVGFSNGGKGVWNAVRQLEGSDEIVSEVVFADGNYGGAWLEDTWKALEARGATLTILVMDGSFAGGGRGDGNRRRAAAFWRWAAPDAAAPSAGREVSAPRLRLVPLRASHHGVGDAAVDYLAAPDDRDVLAGS